MEHTRHEKISIRAYCKWEKAGKPYHEGNKFWDSAEREIVAEEFRRSLRSKRRDQGKVPWAGTVAPTHYNKTSPAIGIG